jgi:hypothetical protein
MDIHEPSPNIREIVELEISPNERILWIGQPRPEK